ncbi:MAG: SufD family Fe-S cluster assembly protein [Alphaproteobacteria bacterium]|nr:SufD family Fe-S cluster assembly protein [Alphaproteobacteria bacterium]
MVEELSKTSVLTISPGQSAVFVEKQLGEKTEIVVGAGAHIRHYRLHDGQDHMLSVRIEQGASYEVITLHRGNGNLMLSFDLAQENAFCRSDIVYVLHGKQESLIRSNVRHNADNTVSRQMVKGAVGGQAFAAFEGGVFIPYERKKIDGAQQHRALLLSPDAAVNAVPQLEIYADDVKCAHGSAIGSLNKDQLYYLRTRGIEEQEARHLLTQAFLDEVFDTIAEEDIREEFKQLAAEGLQNGV